MKILKSGTLTAFAALALTAGHGVHAMPKGETFKGDTLGAIRRPRIRSALAKPKMPKEKAKTLVGKILAFAKTHPKKSILFCLIGSIGVSLSANVIHNKRERRKKTKTLISNIKNLLEGDYLEGQFERFSPLIEALKDAIEKGESKGEILRKDVLDHLLCAISYLYCDARQSSKNGSTYIFSSTLGSCARRLEGVLCKWRVQEEVDTHTRALKKAIIELMKEKLFEEMQEIRVALGRNDHLAGLVDAFKSFEDRVSNIDDFGLWDEEWIIELSHLMERLRELEKGNLSENIIGKLESVIHYLEDFKRYSLVQVSRMFIVNLTELMKEKLSAEMQETGIDLGKSNHLAGLVDAFESFEDRVNSTEDLVSGEIIKLSDLMRDLRRATKENASENIIRMLNSASYYQNYIKRSSLKKVSHTFLTALTELMKEKLSEEMQEIREALSQNNRLAGLVDAFKSFENCVNSIKGLNSGEIVQLSYLMEYLRHATKENLSEDDILIELQDADYRLSYNINSEGLKYSIGNFRNTINNLRNTIKVVIDQLRGNGSAGEAEEEPEAEKEEAEAEKEEPEAEKEETEEQ